MRHPSPSPAAPSLIHAAHDISNAYEGDMDGAAEFLLDHNGKFLAEFALRVWTLTDGGKSASREDIVAALDFTEES